MYPVRESDGVSHRAVPASVARTRAIRASAASAEDRGSRCRIARHGGIAEALDRSRPIARDQRCRRFAAIRPPRDPPKRWRSIDRSRIQFATAGSRLLTSERTAPPCRSLLAGSLAIGAASGDPVAQGGPPFTVPRAHPRALTAPRRGMMLDDSSPDAVPLSLLRSYLSLFAPALPCSDYVSAISWLLRPPRISMPIPFGGAKLARESRRAIS